MNPSHEIEPVPGRFETAPYALLENLIEGCQIIGPDWRYLYLNEAAARQGRSSREQLIGRTLQEVYPGIEKTFMFEQLQQCMAHRTPCQMENQLTHTDGSKEWFEQRIMPVPEGVFILSLDISARKQIEEGLRESEEKFRLTFDSSPDAININRLRDGLYVDINEGFTQMTGFTRGDVTGKTSAQIAIWHDPTDRQKLVQGLLSQGFYNNLEARFRKKDGSLTTALMSARVIPLNGEPHIISITRDISERKHAEAEREKLLMAIEQAHEIVAITDKAGAMQYVNPAFEAITGFMPAEAIGQNPRLLKSGQHDVDFYRGMWDTILSGFPWAGRIVNKRKDGSLYSAECSISPIKTAQGEVSNFVWISRDITKEMELEKRVSQAQKMEAIGALAGGIAHDFNNLLFPITGLAEMLIEDLEPGSANHENAAEILVAAKRASDLVHQILAFSRLSEPQRSPVSLQLVLKEVLKLARATIPANIEIVQDLQGDCGLVLADPTQVHQIALNLITNALHAVEPSGGKISIRLAQVALPPETAVELQLVAGPYALMTITDTGHGISPDIMGKIYEPYFTTKKQGKGTGLGLSMVYGIVKEYGGAIHLTSEVGKGTTFGVFLPLALSEAQLSPSTTSNDDVSGTEKILLIDDETAIVRLETQILERLGYRVDACTGSIAALKKFLADPHGIDLVITDMTMPNMTGDQLAKEMLLRRPGLPIIICTGFSENISEEKAAALGIQGLLMKPVEKSKMARLVRTVLDRAKRAV